MASPSIVDPVPPDCDTSTPQGEPQPNPTDTHEPELPKPWNIEDPFQYAPPNTKGDHWDLLLEPCLKSDKLLCDAWRDEVQNLLIFAGLFSSVVTAFIIESYKNLQQNPNDIMIGLLTHIALRLDGSLNNASTTPLSVQKPFSPSPSTIRVNTFWFISLVLSLTTVLVGIVSLQWLQAHQHYSNLSSRERYAVFVMRSRAMNGWFVPQVFTVMPLLLQCALILFLGGLVDFIHNLGYRNVLIPVAIAIAFTLSFIVATTLLPSLQILSLYSRLPNFGEGKGKWVNCPHPCPYKSPQSYAFCQLLRPLAKLCDRLHPPIRSIIHQIRHHIKNPFSSIKVPALEVDDFTRYLILASSSESWIKFDLAWLAIRDGYSRRAYGRSSAFELIGRSWTLNLMIGGRDNEIVPIYDIVAGIATHGYEKATTVAGYHALCEISELTLLPLKRPDYYYQTLQDIFRQSAYLHDLLRAGVVMDEEATLPDIFFLDKMLYQSLTEENLGTTLNNIPTILLHHQNLSYYLRYQCASDAPMLSIHHAEIAVRLLQYFCLRHPEQRQFIEDDNLRYPGCLVLMPFDWYLTSGFNDKTEFNDVAWQVSNVILLVLQQLTRDSGPSTFLDSLFFQKNLVSFMGTASFFTFRSLQYVSSSNMNDSLSTAVRDTFYAIFSLFEDRLNKEILSWPSPEGRPTLIFYLAATYVQLVNIRGQNPPFTSLYSTVCKYKRRTIDMGITDPVIEERLKSDPNSKYLPNYDKLFSPDWWQGFKPSSSSPPSNSPSIVMYYPITTSMSQNTLPQDDTQSAIYP